MEPNIDIETVHLKYSELDQAEIIKKGDSTSLAKIENEIAKIYEWERQYYDDQDYRRQLPESARKSMEREFEHAINLFQRITSLRTKDVAAFAQEKDDRVKTVKHYYEVLYDLFVRDYRGWKLDQQQSDKIKQLDQIIMEAKKKGKKIEQDADKISRREEATAEATQDIGLSRLANYFYQLVRGDYEWDAGEKDNLWRKLWFGRILKWGRGYQGAARIWLMLALAAFGFAYYVTNSQLFPFVQDLTGVGKGTAPLVSSSASTIYALLVAKALILAVPIYAIKFCLKNYGSNKHLAADALHKAKTLQTLQTYLEIPRNDPAAIREIATTVAQLVFTPTDSGFIPQKGESDGPQININGPTKLA